MARNLTTTHTPHDNGGSVTTVATTTTEAEKPKRERKAYGPGAAADRVLALVAKRDAEYAEAIRIFEAQWRVGTTKRVEAILSHCTDPAAAHRMLKAREGE